jgi:adenylate cyclase
MSAAQRLPTAVLFAELRNFTRLSDVLEPAKVLQLASEFFSLCASCASACGGRGVSMRNDSFILAFTGASPAPQAFQCAQMVQREFTPLGERWKTEFGLPAAVAQGLHVGDAVSGSAGPSGARQDLVFGDTVAIAERLLRRARTGEIVLTADVMKFVGGASGARPLPALDMGRRPPLVIYGVVLETRLDFT